MSKRLATSFVHIIPDLDEYEKNEESYLRGLIGNLIDNLNERVSKRTTQYEHICFKNPLIPFKAKMTKEPLSSIFMLEDCLQLFNFIYSSDIEQFSNTDAIFDDFPHITKEFLGADTASNKNTLKRSHKGNDP